MKPFIRAPNRLIPLNCSGHFITIFDHFAIPESPMFFIGGLSILWQHS